jgi:hypothetical protein
MGTESPSGLPTNRMTTPDNGTDHMVMRTGSSMTQAYPESGSAASTIFRSRNKIGFSDGLWVAARMSTPG